jgi:hypothetical protein
MTKAVVSEIRELKKKHSVKYKLVSAGSVKKHNEAFIRFNREYVRESLVLDSKGINKDDYTSFVVDGKSMRKFGVENGDIVLVAKENNLSVTDTSIFVLSVYPKQRNKIEYKLRKPIDFYDCQDDSEEKFADWIGKHPELDAERLNGIYNTEIRGKIAECKRLGCRLLVSETTRKRKVHYSFHPENRIFGTVEYVIQNENVEIIEKR